MRCTFEAPARPAGTNTYVTVEDSLSLRNHLAVRKTLRLSPDLRDRYAAVKQKVAATAANIDEYGKGKNALIQEIPTVAGFTEAERVTIDTAQVPSHDEVPR